MLKLLTARLSSEILTWFGSDSGTRPCVKLFKRELGGQEPCAASIEQTVVGARTLEEGRAGLRLFITSLLTYSNQDLLPCVGQVITIIIVV